MMGLARASNCRDQLGQALPRPREAKRIKPSSIVSAV
jgi:hypothetical protein